VEGTISLYDPLQAAYPALEPLVITPATLKALLGNLIDLLIEQQISAHFWTKLPRDPAWTAELQRYSQNNLHRSMTSLPLAKGEYFCLVIADQCQVLWLAQRVETLNLKLLYSHDRTVIEWVIEKIIPCLLQASLDPDPLHKFQDRSPSLTGIPEESPAFMESWILKQIHRQEELRQKLLTYRQQSTKAEKLQVQVDELETALRFKDDLLKQVVQELRTPLTNMKTALTLLQSSSLKPTQRQRYTEVLTKEWDRQNSLINSLLDLTQLQDQGPHESSSLQVNDLIPSVISALQPLAQERNLQLSCTIPQELLPVKIGEAELRQVLINLLHNSLQFTPKGGKVWVNAIHRSHTVQIEISDTGIGIAASEIPKIFNSFYRVPTSGGQVPMGAGLGLTIVQYLLQRCGGSIQVDSQLGKGATFTVILPIDEEKRDEGISRSP
jgi:signal transduction histidine kinase